MWRQLIREYARLLGSHLYPALYTNPDYQAFLAGAGIRPPFPASASGLSAEQRKRLSECALIRAKLCELELKDLDSLEHAGARAVELTGPLRLYRLYNSNVTGNEFRFFWFREDLLLESFHAAGGSKVRRLEWLRGRLAVAYNWSLCDRLAQLKLKAGETLPAVEAIGLPVRGVTVKPKDLNVGAAGLPSDYWKNYGKYSASLPGGAAQLLLFMLPDHGVIRNYW